MSMKDIMQGIHRQHRVKDLKKLNEELYKKYKADTCSYEEWLLAMKKCGYDTRRFYVNESKRVHNRFNYVGEYATVEFPTLMRGWLGNDFTIRQKEKNEHYKEMFDEGNYMMFFFPEGNSFAIDYFEKFIGKVPKGERFEQFVGVYTLLESGFTEFSKEIVEDMLALAPKEATQRELRENNEVDVDGKVRVYRGVHSDSSKLEKSISWTLSSKVAKSFANRFEKGKVYSGLVNVEDIVYFNDERREEEVWVRYGKIEGVTVEK